MEVEIKKEGPITVVSIGFDIDGKTAPDVQAKVLGLVEKGGRLLLDFSRVGYMSSAGLRVLLTMHRQVTANQARLVLVGLSDDLKEVMEATGFLSFFTIHPTLPEGLAALA
ncbi:MAG: STAS domain-containing protein [Deltaproteobacteria bacterium]|nr:STAS domain-containing protein [Deltaproteobacteria bacterium]